MQSYLISFLKTLEEMVSPKQYQHHALTYARYGSDEKGWEDRLALQVNEGGTLHCYFLDDDDLKDEPQVLASKIATLVQEPMDNEHLGISGAQYHDVP